MDTYIEDSQYRTFFGRYHVSTVTKSMSLLHFVVYFAYIFLFLDSSSEMQVISGIISLIYLTPFIAHHKTQPWILAPLLVLLAFDLWICSFYFANILIQLLLTMSTYPYDRYPFLFPLAFFDTFYFYFVIRFFKYLKEMKLLQQKEPCFVQLTV